MYPVLSFQRGDRFRCWAGWYRTQLHEVQISTENHYRIEYFIIQSRGPVKGFTYQYKLKYNDHTIISHIIKKKHTHTNRNHILQGQGRARSVQI